MSPLLRLRLRAGFTLIELLVTVVIIGILASLAMTVFWKAKDRGLRASLETDLRTMVAKQEEFFETNLTYAADPNELPDYRPTPGVMLAISYAEVDGWAGVATHEGLPETIRCGMIIGNAPAGENNPASATGRLACTD
jgi:prepilin-type N-terminal cleavage/methylation domain-containing protein